MLFVWNDWAEEHHDVEAQDADGSGARRCLSEGLDGVAQSHALLVEHASAGWEQLSAEQVAERDRDQNRDRPRSVGGGAAGSPRNTRRDTEAGLTWATHVSERATPAISAALSARKLSAVILSACVFSALTLSMAWTAP